MFKDKTPPRGTRTKRRAGKRSMPPRSRTTIRTRNSRRMGCRKRSDSRPGVQSYWSVHSPSLAYSFQLLTLNVNSDVGYDHSHSTSTLLLFNCLRRERAFRQVEGLLQLLYVEFKLTCTCLFCSLGGDRNDLDVLLIVHSGLVSALGIQGGSYSDFDGNCQGTVFPIIAVCDRTAKPPLFLLFAV